MRRRTSFALDSSRGRLKLALSSDGPMMSLKPGVEAVRRSGAFLMLPPKFLLPDFPDGWRKPPPE